MILIRVLDSVLASIGLIVASPLLSFLYVVGLFDTGSPLFIQERVGRNRRPFRLVKFRTMRPGTPEVATHMADASAVTRWGAFLRRTKLDELPQLWNVLKGDMSLVGPRPCLPNQTELIAARERLGVFAVRPGITGLAQIQGIDMSDPERLAKVDAEMVRRLNVGFYLRCLLLTLAGRGFDDPIARASRTPASARMQAIPSPFHHPRAFLAFSHDLLAAAFAWTAAFWLRFSPDWPEPFWRLMLDALPWVVSTQGLTFLAFGLYRGIWRYASLPDLKRLVATVAVAGLASPAVVLLSHPGVVLPRSVLLLDPVLLLLLMGGSRLAYRAWKEHRLSALVHPERRPALVIGAGSAADAFLRDQRRQPGVLELVGLLDDDPGKRGRQLHGVPVLGPIAALPELARRLAVETAILAIPSAGHRLRRRVAELAQDAGVKLVTLPGMGDILAGRVAVESLRGLELEDLLGRDPVALDQGGLRAALAGQTVLVTGGAGSIGSELCRQLLALQPARLVVLDASEYGLYRCEAEFSRRHPDAKVDYLACDVRDEARMEALLKAHRPRWVFHAAAYKHVPLMENANALECLRNNVLGTWVAARAAIAAGVEKFILVSTDKAVNPTNVMGASKRLAELVCQAQVGEGTQFVAVRFGNVLGSSGSVVPLFRQQIESGGPVTVTHPEVTRYFMTIPEAAQLVLQAGLMGKSGEIYVLDMGEPVKIVDLARLMIRLAGRSEEEIPIVFTGLRPGEKLYEEVLADSETTLATPHPRLRIARAQQADGAILAELVHWLQDTPEAPADEVRARLQAWLPEYRPAAP